MARRSRNGGELEAEKGTKFMTMNTTSGHRKVPICYEPAFTENRFEELTGNELCDDGWRAMLEDVKSSPSGANGGCGHEHFDLDVVEVESAAEETPPTAPDGDPWQTALGDPWISGAISTPVQPSTEVSETPKAESLGDEFRRKLGALTSPTTLLQSDLDYAMATTTPTKDEFMRRLRMIEMRHTSSEKQATPRDIEDHDRPSRSVAGSLLHADEAADAETSNEEEVHHQLEGENKDNNSSEESDEARWSQSVPKSWAIASGRWKREIRTSKISLPRCDPD